MTAPIGSSATRGAARDPRAEAQEVVGDGYAARVLEPSPPAVTSGELADDPVADGELGPGRQLLTPAPARGLTWDAWLSDHPDRRDWAADRWLGAHRHLPRPGSTYPVTRAALHRVAAYVVTPARRRVNGKIGLRWTLGGFGTPFFGDDEQVRVDGDHIVRQRGSTAISEPISSLAGAAALALDGPPDAAWAGDLDVPPLGDPDESLPVDPGAAAFLGDWFGFVVSVLEELRAQPASSDPSLVQLWPEHFDAAFDCLSRDDRRRATFGGSPGDDHVPEPYLYVTPWHFEDVAASDGWNAASFPGAILPLDEFVDAKDQRGRALAFFEDRRSVLEHHGGGAR